MERPISEEELLKLIKALLNNKAPGEDGLPAEFYKVFWIDIKKYLLDSYNFSYNNNTLSITQKRGVISLIPKKDDPLFRHPSYPYLYGNIRTKQILPYNYPYSIITRIFKKNRYIPFLYR